MTVTEWLRLRLQRQVSIRCERMSLSPEQILCRKRSPEFDTLRNNRLLVGAFRYGMNGGFDCISSAIRRLQEYQKTGNKEHLVDAANLCELEWIQENNPLAHWDPQDDGEHCEPHRK